MVSAHDFYATKTVDLAPELADRHGRSQQVLGRHSSQATNEFRPDQVQLPFQKAAAIGKLGRQRVTVPGRPAFDHIQNIDVFPFDPTRFDDLVEQLSATADE